jgi:hypothetical protein
MPSLSRRTAAWAGGRLVMAVSTVVAFGGCWRATVSSRPTAWPAQARDGAGPRSSITGAQAVTASGRPQPRAPGDDRTPARPLVAAHRCRRAPGQHATQSSALDHDPGVPGPGQRDAQPSRARGDRPGYRYSLDSRHGQPHDRAGLPESCLGYDSATERRGRSVAKLRVPPLGGTVATPRHRGVDDAIASCARRPQRRRATERRSRPVAELRVHAKE